MKFVVGLLLLAACAEALPRRKDLRNDLDSQLDDLIDDLLELERKEKERAPHLAVRSRTCPPEEMDVSPGEVLEGALVTHTESDGLYPNNACQTWIINAEQGQCIVITVGDGGFDTESNHDEVVIEDYTAREVHHMTTVSSHHSPGSDLFHSKSKGVKVTFLSDGSIRRSGFTLDVSSISCHSKPKPPEKKCAPQQVDLSPGELFEGALVSHTESDGLYPDNACQTWIVSAGKDQCLVFTVGDGGFDTESKYDKVTMEDIGSRVEVDCENDVLGGSRSGTGGQKSKKKRQNGVYCTVELDILIDVGERWGDCECMPSGKVQCGCFVGDILIRPGERWGDACRFCECLPSEELKCEMNGKRSATIFSPHSESDVLFHSLTNRVNVTFTSDASSRRSGFTLDVHSTSCHRPFYG